MSSPPPAGLSQIPKIEPAAQNSLPITKSENFRARMLEAFLGEYRVTLELLMHKLDVEDVQLSGGERYMRGYGKDHYYQCLQNEALHSLHPEAIRAIIAGQSKRVIALAEDGTLPEQLEPVFMDDGMDTLTKQQEKLRRPLIYTHFHVDSDGDPPSASEYSHIIGEMKDYLKLANARIQGRMLPSLQKMGDEIDEQVPLIDLQDEWPNASM